MNDITVTVTDLRKDVPGFLEQLMIHHRATITRRGHPVAFVVSAPYYRANNRLIRQLSRLYGLPPTEQLTAMVQAMLEHTT